MTPKEWLEVGYVSRAHGLRGTLVVKTYDEASTALGEVDRVQLIPRAEPAFEAELADVREGPGGDLLIELDAVTTRERADALVGSKVSVHRDELEPPEAGEVFQGDLVGLTAKTPEGKLLGTVVEVFSAGPVPNLVIGTAPDELMVPFAEEFVVKIDLAAREIVIVPPTYDEA